MFFSAIIGHYIVFQTDQLVRTAQNQVYPRVELLYIICRVYRV